MRILMKYHALPVFCFLKRQNLKLSSTANCRWLQIVDGALWVTYDTWGIIK